MRELLRTFAGLTLCWVGAEKLLDEGRMRDAARVVCGLLTMLLVVRGASALLGRVEGLTLELPETLTQEAFAGAAAAGEETAEGSLLRQAEDMAAAALAQAGCAGECRAARSQEGLNVTLRLTSGDGLAARLAVAAALGLDLAQVKETAAWND